MSVKAEEVYEPVESSSRGPSDAPELFAKHLSKAPEGHKYHGYKLWMLQDKKLTHYIIFKKNAIEGHEILPSTMHRFAFEQDFFTSGEHSIDYTKRKEEWERMPKESDD